MTSMAPPDPLPKYVYKITPTAPPEPIPEEYPLSDLDKQDSFVHLSTSWQIPITAGLFFKSTSQLWIIKLRLERFAGQTRWDEVPGTNGCPHLYGNFGRGDVEAVGEFQREESQGWAEVLVTGEGTFLE